jgi:hypothetical protein
MRPGDFQALLRRLPFVPFRIILSTGAEYEIRHPELVGVTRSTVILEFPGALDPIPLPTRKVIISLLHIVQIETTVPPSSGSKGNGNDQASSS